MLLNNVQYLIEYITKADREEYEANRHNVPIDTDSISGMVGPHVRRRFITWPNSKNSDVVIPHPGKQIDNMFGHLPDDQRQKIKDGYATIFSKLGVDRSYMDTGNLTGRGAEFVKNHELAHHQLNHVDKFDKYNKELNANLSDQQTSLIKKIKTNININKHVNYRQFKNEAEADKLAYGTMNKEKGLSDDENFKNTKQGIKDHLRNANYAKIYYTKNVGKLLDYGSGRLIHKMTHSNNRIIKTTGLGLRTVKRKILGTNKRVGK